VKNTAHQLNRYQKILLIVALVNIAVVMLFPPFDAVPLVRAVSHTFDGFYYVFGYHVNREINKSLLHLEVFLVRINMTTAWLLLSDVPGATAAGARRRHRQGIAAMAIVNLAVMLLFPPFETYSSILRIQVPSFDGFYFIFGDKFKRNLFIPILYMEVSFVFINAALFLLLFGESERAQSDLAPEQVSLLAKSLAPEDARKLAQELQQQVLIDSMKAPQAPGAFPADKDRRKRART
jgi:hypothetical protein